LNVLSFLIFFAPRIFSFFRSWKSKLFFSVHRDHCFLYFQYYRIITMLSFATFEEAPASMSLVSYLTIKEAADTTYASYAATFWFLLVLAVFALNRGGCWHEGFSSLPRKLSISVEAMKDRCCSKRRARYLKCAHRCNRRKGGAQGEAPLDYECCLWQKIYQLHLPPPLPFKRHKTKCKSEDPKDPQGPLNDSTTTVAVNDNSATVSSKDVGKTHSVSLTHQQQVGEVSESSFSKRALPTKVLSSTFKPEPSWTSLIDLARMQRWPTILQQVTRREAKYHDMDGLYPLHWACSGGPPTKVIQALLDRYPSAARKVDQEGSTPLHFACHYSASVGVLEALLQVYPKAIRMQDKYGRTPLYHAAHKSAGMEILDKLLKADPTTATISCVPAWAHEQVAGDNSRALAVRTPLFLAWAAVLSDRRTREEKRGKKWDKATLLLQTAYQHSSNVSPTRVQRPFQSLHAAISLDLYLPESVVPMITQAHPEQLERVDPNTGQLPLVLVAGMSHYSTSRSKSLIELLLQGYPRAAQSRDRQGRFPLSLAMASGKRFDAGVELLLQAAPETLLWRDGQTGLVPALSAASAIVEKTKGGTDSELTSTGLSNDPFGLLNTKQRESISRLQERPAGPLPSNIDAAVNTADPATCHLTTIYELINAHPSAIVQAKAT
jgi:ankyrin repeat protein